MGKFVWFMLALTVVLNTIVHGVQLSTDYNNNAFQRDINIQPRHLEIRAEVKNLITLNAKQTKLRAKLNKLNMSQYRILISTFSKAHPFDLQYTMTAIAWHESTFGRNPINLSDPSFGVFHNLITSVVSRTGTKDTAWNRSRVAERLLLDFDFSFSQSLAELKYWDNYWKSKKVPKTWSKMVMSYNAGHKYQNGEAYLKAIKDKIKALRSYTQDHNNIFKAILRRSY